MRLLLLLSLLLASACTLAPEPIEKESASPLAALPVPVPEELAKTRLVETHRFENPAAGVMYRYRGDIAMQPDVYIYPLPEVAIEILLEQGEAALLAAEYRRYISELELAVERNYYESFEEEFARQANGSFSYEGADGEVSLEFPVVWSKVSLQAGGPQLDSYMVLAEINGNFVKLRISHPEYPGLEQNVQYFVNHFLTGIYQMDMRESRLSMQHAGLQREFVRQPGESLAELWARVANASEEANRMRKTDPE